MTDNHLLLNRLAELMLKHEKHILPVDLLFDDEQIGEFVKSIQIDSPYQQMLLEGVLTESVKNEQLYVSFTVEGYFHFVLGEFLFKINSENRYTILSRLLLTNSLTGIKEGITQCLIRCAGNGENDPILMFIDNGHTEICILPLITALNRDSLTDILNDLLKDESDADYAVVLEVISILKINGKKKLVDDIIQFFAQHFAVIDLKDEYYFRQRLKIILLQSFEDDQFTLLIESVINDGNNCFLSFNNNKKLELLFELNNIIVNKGLLILSNNFAEKFNLYFSEIKLIIDNYYNLIYPLLELGKFEVAESIYLRCSPTNNTNASFLNWSGFIYQSWYELESNDENHLNEGLKLYELSSKFLDVTYGKYSIQKYQNLENLGYTYSLLNDYEKSVLILNQAVDIVVKTFNSKVVYQLGNLYEMLAVTFNEIGKHSEAINYTFLSDDCKLLQVSDDSPEMAWNHATRSKIYLNMNDTANAIESMKLAYEIRKNALGEDNGITIQTKEDYNKLINDL